MTRSRTLAWLAFALGIACALMTGHLAWASGASASPGNPSPLPQLKTAGISTAETDQAEAAAPAVRFRTRTLNSEWQDWQGNGMTAGSPSGTLPLVAIAAELSGSIEGCVQYQVHVTDVGWLPVASDGVVAKPQAGINRPVDAVRMALTGRISQSYSLAYRVSALNSGWQAWKADGASAGSASQGIGIRALQVKLVKKPKASAAGTGIIGIRYRVNSQTIGWSAWQTDNAIAGPVDKGQRALGFQIALDPGSYKGGVRYRVHFQDGSWSAWMADGSSTGSSSKVNGIQVQLTGAMAKSYDVVYRAYVQSIGWQRRMRNGETAGTASKDLRIEAFRVNLVAKSDASGWIKSNGTWSYYQSGKRLTASWLTTNEHPIATTASGKQRYWLDSKGVLAVKRYVKPTRAADRKAGFIAYATSSGYVARGKFKNSDGMLLSDKSTGSIYTGTRWLKTKAYDGKQQVYRLVKKGSIATVKTGLFKVNGKSYYGWPGNKGYLMRSTTRYMGSNWYEANAKGVLTIGGNANTKAIERYVKWAVKIANDNAHGYSQANRWGPDYDCSSLVCASILSAGFPDSGASWTGNMKECLTRIGFKWHSGTAGLQRGDIMLVHSSWRQHTEIYIGNGKLVGAHISENGTIYGKAGDQTGNEISVGAYYNAPWQGYLRFKG